MRSCRDKASRGALALGVVSIVLLSDGAIASGPLTLADAVLQALSHGPEARIASLETGQAGDALAAARSAYFPRATISSQAGYSNRQDEKLRAVDRNGRERTYGLSSLGSNEGWFNFYIDQLLFDLSTWRGVERAALSTEAGQVVEAEKREAVSLEVLGHYTEALRLDEMLALDARRVAAVERLDARAANLLAAGRIVHSEREVVALALESVRMEASARAGARADARRALANTIGEDDTAGSLAGLVPESLSAVVHLENDFDAEEDLATAPELRLLSLRKRMEDVSVAAARAERYPTVGLRAGYSNYGAKRFDNFSDELSVGVDFRMPLFDGYKARHAIAGALKGAAIARLRYKSALERKRAKVRELSRQLVLGRRKPELAARQAAIAEEHVRLADVRLQNDRGSLDDVLAAQDTWARVARAAIDARFDAVVLWASVQREVGRLSTSILGSADLPRSAAR